MTDYQIEDGPQAGKLFRASLAPVEIQEHQGKRGVWGFIGASRAFVLLSPSRPGLLKWIEEQRAEVAAARAAEAARTTCSKCGGSKSIRVWVDEYIDMPCPDCDATGTRAGQEARQARIKAADDAADAREARERASGKCAKCGTWCYGDCGR